jgi:hypothetical protein
MMVGSSLTVLDPVTGFFYADPGVADANAVFNEQYQLAPHSVSSFDGDASSILPSTAYKVRFLPRMLELSRTRWETPCKSGSRDSTICKAHFRCQQVSETVHARITTQPSFWFPLNRPARGQATSTRCVRRLAHLISYTTSKTCECSRARRIRPPSRQR